MYTKKYKKEFLCQNFLPGEQTVTRIKKKFHFSMAALIE